MLKSVRTTRDTINAAGLGFSRAVATVDPLGASIASGEPRFDHPLALVSPPGAETNIVTGGANNIIVCGYDAQTMRVYRVTTGGATAEYITFLGGVGNEENASEGTTKKTLTLGTQQNFTPVNDHAGSGDATLAYQAFENGGVRDNFVIVSGSVMEDITTSANYTDGRFFIAYSLDRGDTFTLLHDEIASDAGMTFSGQRGRLGNSNLVGGPFIQTDEAGDEWLIFTTSDYKTASGTFTAGGGELWAVIAKRQSNGDWGQVTKMLVFGATEWGAFATGVQHCHSGGFIFKTDSSGNVWAIAIGFTGDTIRNNAIMGRKVRLANIRTGLDDSAITEASDAQTQWSSVFDLHGNISDTNTTWLWGYQPVGVAPAKNCRSLLMGADENRSIGVMRLDADDFDLTSNTISRIHRVAYFANGRNASVNCFQLGADPDLSGAFVAGFDDQAADNADDNLACFSPDGVHAGFGTSANMALRSNYAYLRDLSAGTLSRIARPTAIIGRPLTLGRGGTNAASATLTQTTNANDGVGGGTALVAADAGDLANLPDRPFAGGDTGILKAEHGPGDGTFLHGEYQVAASVAAGNLIASIAAAPIDPTPTLPWWQYVSQWELKGNVGGAGGSFSPAAIRTLYTGIPGEWEVSQIEGVNGSTQNIKLRVSPVRVLNIGIEYIDLRSNHAFKVFDLRTDGIWPGYPIAPGASSQPNETVAPVGQHAIGSGWQTLLLALGVPTYAWDRHARFLPNQAAGANGLELCRITGDAENYIAVGLRCARDMTGTINDGVGSGTDGLVVYGLRANNSFRIEVAEAGGTDEWKAVRGAQILVGISHDGTDIIATAYCNEAKGTSATTTLSAFATRPTTLREPQDTAYWPVNLWGYSWSEDALSASAMESELVSLPFTTNVGGVRTRNFRQRAGGYVR